MEIKTGIWKIKEHEPSKIIVRIEDCDGKIALISMGGKDDKKDVN